MPKKVESTIVVPDNLTPFYSNGAVGGITPRGEMVIYFFNEVHAIGGTERFEVQGNQLVKIPDPQKSDEMVALNRNVQTAVIMTMPSLKELHKWIGDLITNFEAKQVKK